MTARPKADLREIILRKSRESTATKEQFFSENAEHLTYSHRLPYPERMSLYEVHAPVDKCQRLVDRAKCGHRLARARDFLDTIRQDARQREQHARR